MISHPDSGRRPCKWCLACNECLSTNLHEELNPSGFQNLTGLYCGKGWCDTVGVTASHADSTNAW